MLPDSAKKNAFHKKLMGLTRSPLASIFCPVRFEMNGNREVIIEGFKNIVEYEEDTIKIGAPKMIVCFRGRNLSIKSLTTDSLIIKGFIISMEFVT